MHAALMWLKEENAALSEIRQPARLRIGSGVQRAFKRFVGISPGAARRREPRALHNAGGLAKAVERCVSIDHHMRSPPDIASLTPGRGVMPAHGWIFSCLASIPMNCSIRRRGSPPSSRSES